MPLGAWAIVLLLILGSVRGAIVVNFDISSNSVYLASAGSLLLLSLVGMIHSFNARGRDLKRLRFLMTLNVAFGIGFLLIEFLLGMQFEAGVLYVLLAPFIVFLFLRLPSRYMNFAFAVIALMTSYSVLSDFIEMNSGPRGYDGVVEKYEKLRPNLELGVSRTGEFFRAAGYTASYHDSAQILGMLVCFFFIRFMLRKNFLDLGIALFGVLSLTLTQSAANIVVAGATVAVFSAYLLLRAGKASNLVFTLIAVLAMGGLIAFFGQVMSIFAARLSPEGDWAGMFRMLDPASLIDSVPFVLLGHANAMGSAVITTEVGYLKDIYQLGIVHIIVLYGILLFPIIRYRKLNATCIDAMPTIAALSFGFLSLIHYGSLFRVTNVFLYFGFYSVCLNLVLNCRKTQGGPDSHPARARHRGAA